jgi:hypothetical protein
VSGTKTIRVDIMPGMDFHLVFDFCYVSTPVKMFCLNQTPPQKKNINNNNNDDDNNNNNKIKILLLSISNDTISTKAINIIAKQFINLNTLFMLGL